MKYVQAIKRYFSEGSANPPKSAELAEFIKVCSPRIRVDQARILGEHFNEPVEVEAVPA